MRLLEKEELKMVRGGQPLGVYALELALIAIAVADGFTVLAAGLTTIFNSINVALGLPPIGGSGSGGGGSNVKHNPIARVV